MRRYKNLEKSSETWVNRIKEYLRLENLKQNYLYIQRN